MTAAEALIEEAISRVPVKSSLALVSPTRQGMTLREAFMRRLKSYEQELLADPSLVTPERLQELHSKGFAVLRQ